MIPKNSGVSRAADEYESVLTDVVRLIETGRRRAVRTVNAALSITYWEIGRRIVEEEQHGSVRAGYGEALLKRLSVDLRHRFGRGFSESNLQQMRSFFLVYREPFASSPGRKSQTLSGKFEVGTYHGAEGRFPLPWSHYVRLLGLRSDEARRFYETEALRGGWRASMLRKGARQRQCDAVRLEEEIKDPYVLEFLDLKDEYSEMEAEGALIAKLESFLMELGDAFAFVGRQRRLRVGDEWYRVDLIFFHRLLRCLVIVDLKAGKFTHADSGQMHLYLNYARENWMRPGENPPVGLILCARKNEVLAHYALDGLPNKVLAAEYLTTLPEEQLIGETLTKAGSALPHREEAPKRSRRASSCRGPRSRRARKAQ